MKKYNFLLTDNIKKVNKNESYISIRPQKNYLILNHLNDLSKDTNYNKISRRQIIKKYEFCEKIYSKLIKELSKKLNKFHKVNYPIRSWEIIAGKWLKDLIYIVYKTYSEIKYVIKHYNIKKIYSINTKNYDLALNGTIDQRLAFVNADWFYSISSHIIDFFYSKKKIVKNLPKKKYFLLREKIFFKNSFNIIVKKIIFKIVLFIKYFFKLNNYALILNTYLPFIFEKMLEIKFFQIPSFWNYNHINYSKRNKVLRLNFDFYKKKSYRPFEKFLRSKLNLFLPNFLLEDFNKISLLVKKTGYPKNPRFIFTSNSFSFDEVFKFYVANQTIKKIPYYIGQHGNNYFTKICSNYFTEFKESDRFLSWGTKKSPKVINCFNFKVMNEKKYFNNKGNLIILFDHIDNMTFDLNNTNQAMFSHLNKTIDVIKNLKKEIKEKTIVRLNSSFYNDYFGFKYFKLFNNLGVEIDNGQTKIDKLLKGSRLCFYNYDSTGLLENLLYNHPTIFFCEKNFLNGINKNYLEKYNLLLKNKIMFLSKKKLETHLNQNWLEVEKWWFNEKNKKIFNTFNKNFNVRSNKNSLEKLKKILVT